jgi:Putative metallopeptidase
MQAWRNHSVQRSGSAARHCLQGCVLMIALLLGAGLVFGQSEQSEVKQFQATAKEAADALQDNVKPEKRAQLQRDSAVQFILGNTLFVVLHESGHTTISELGLPVLGRQEDAADAFAVVTLLKVGSVISRRVLVEAAKGWFLSDLRDKRDGEKLVFYDEHGLDEQRAYQIVCLMVGSDPVKYKDLADETKLPVDRQESCKQDYADASSSWEEVLKPHRRATNQAKTKIDVVYGEGNGALDVYAKGFKAARLLEVVAEHLADQLALPTSFTLEMRSCGFINAAWVATTRKLTVCYELADDFADLYRVHGPKLQ